MTGRRMRRFRRGAVAAVLIIASAPAAFGITEFTRDRIRAGNSTPAPTPPPAFAGATATPPSATVAQPPVITAAGVARALAEPLADENLGRRLQVEVQDIATGAVLYRRRASSPATPASTLKLLTGAAALAALEPTERFVTEVRRLRRDGTVFLVGGGDPTLSAVPGSGPSDFAGAARISDLAAQIEKRNIPVNRIVVDDSLFAGPRISPRWAKNDVPLFASAITPLMADGGRTRPHDEARSEIPDLAAAQSLAAALDIPNATVTRGRAPKRSVRVAVVRSAPVRTLVRQMLLESDNTLAEVLGRHVALAEGQPASFTGAVRGIQRVLSRHGIDVGNGIVDASGLSNQNRVTADALVDLLAAASSSARLSALLADLPVAAWSGTLKARYRGPIGRYAAGLIRGKTGTLEDVSSLAGVVHTTSGRLLAFAFIADRVPGGLTPYAEGALDVAVTRLAQCGCA